MAPKNESTTPTSTSSRVMARYAAEVVPLLRAAGFDGTRGHLTRRDGVCELLAYATRRAPGRVKLGLTAFDGRAALTLAHLTLSGEETIDEATVAFDAYLASVREEALPRVAQLCGTTASTTPTTLAEAARALVQHVARDPEATGPAVEGVEVDGRTLVVRTADREIRVDRAALLTLLRELHGLEPSPARDLGAVLRGDALDAYVERLAQEDEAEARALWVHLNDPYDVPSDGHRLARLFPAPLAEAKHLETARSETALLSRALSEAKDAQTLLGRVVASRVVT